VFENGIEAQNEVVGGISGANKNKNMNVVINFF